MLICDYCRCGMDKNNKREIKITISEDNPWHNIDKKNFEVCPECAHRITKILTIGFVTYHNLLKEGYSLDEM